MSRSVVVLALGTAQTLAWASSYYLVAIVADPLGRELRIPATALFAAFSAALLLSAVLGPAVGRAIDRRGSRGVLCLSNLVFAAGLALLAMAHGPVLLTAGWLVLGFGMALGLHDSAFATLAGLYGRDAGGAITGITLIAGFASTVGWLLTAFLDVVVGWRGACLTWAGLHLLVGLPLNRFLVPRAPPSLSGVAAIPTTDADTELLYQVNRMTGFASAFNLRTGERCDDEYALLAAILADATNLGLGRMTAVSHGVTRDKLIWTADAYIRPETYRAALSAATI